MFIRQERSIKEFFYFYPLVSILVILNLVLWVLTHFFPYSLGGTILQYGIGQNLAIKEQGEYWRLLTPIFLHANFGHVLFNSFALVLFGPALERMIGKGKFLLFYLGAGIIGNIGTYIVAPYDFSFHLGASGAIYGLLGIYIYMSLRRQDLIDPQSASIARTIFILGLIMTFLRPNINIAAHLFGFLGGVLLAPICLKKAKPFYQPTYRRRVPEGEIGFDPNRWKKRRLPRKLRNNALWIFIIIIFILYLVSDSPF